MKRLSIMLTVLAATISLAPPSAAGTLVASKADSVLTAGLPGTFQATVPVYLHGVKYPPPHDLDWSGQVLFCHGIPICPMPSAPAFEPSFASRDRFALDCRADSAARATGRPYTSREAFEAMRSVYRTSPLVANAWFDEQGQLRVQFYSQRYPIGVGSPPGVDSRHSEMPIDPYAEALDLEQLLLNAWKWNRIVFIGSGYAQTVSSIDEAERQIEAAKSGLMDIIGPLNKEALQDIIKEGGGR
ncbi:MAG: hypothetical protein V1778_05335 [bacterium]